MVAPFSEAAYEGFLRRAHFVTYIDIAAGALWVYDYLLTFDLEVRLIWGQKSWTYTKLLFVLCRYIPAIYSWPHIQMGLPLNLSPEKCRLIFASTNCKCCGFLSEGFRHEKRLITLFTGLWVIGIYFAQSILCIRTWAVWLQNRPVGIGLLTLIVSTFIVQGYCLYQVTGPSVVAVPQPYPEFFGCSLISSHPMLFYVCFSLVGFIDLVVVVLMLIRAFHSYRQGSDSQLLRAIHRDSVGFYLFFLCSSVMNVAMTTAFEIDILIIPQGVLQSVLTSRIIFNIRKATSESEVTELHEEIPITFAYQRDTIPLDPV